MLKTHSVRASQTCLQTNKQTDEKSLSRVILANWIFYSNVIFLIQNVQVLCDPTCDLTYVSPRVIPNVTTHLIPILMWSHKQSHGYNRHNGHRHSYHLGDPGWLGWPRMTRGTQGDSGDPGWLGWPRVTRVTKGDLGDLGDPGWLGWPRVTGEA